MATINEAELRHIVEGIIEDQDSIVRHNPIGSPAEVLYWMLLSCLISYLSLGEHETPCFSGAVDAGTYREAIEFVLRGRKVPDFDAARILDQLSEV
jgi:hypothetical protein